MANEVKQIETNGTFPDVPSILSSINNSYAEAVIVSNETERTNGNMFVWKNTGAVNDGTVYAGSTGFWEMQHDLSYVDVKWFGAKGDYVNPSSPGNDDTQAIQNALNYATANYLDVYISKGKYRITPPNAGGTASNPSNSLILGTTSSTNSIKIFGAGPETSSLVYDEIFNVNRVIYNNVLRVESVSNVIITIENFEIRGKSFSSTSSQIGWYGCGLYLFNSLPVNVKSMSIWGLNEGIRLDLVNNGKFENCFIQYVNKGVVGETFTPGNGTLPNVLDFISCQFIAIEILAAEFIRAHNINFQSCDLSYGGKKNTPALTQVVAIDCSFDGVNGANGLNVKDCYFEGNKGLADIRVQIETGGHDNPYYGTHTFQGNTFNRNLDLNDKTYYIYSPLDPDNPTPVPALTNPFHTNHNILITGSGQDPKRLFGQSKCKLVFIGNGFFVNVPDSSNNYIPKDTRKAIEIDYYKDDIGTHYWEFDVVEEGNTYNGDPYGQDAPVFTPALPDQSYQHRYTPQVSEFTRVKAFGYYLNIPEGDLPPGNYAWGAMDDFYNVFYVKRIDPLHTQGLYEITYANELKRPGVVVATCVNEEDGINCIPVIVSSTTTGFIIRTVLINGEPWDSQFHFHVF